jgi:hypothetical protein
MNVPFTEFDKISRLNREVIVTEKIDGTNGQVHIRPAAGDSLEMGYDTQIDVNGEPHYIRAGLSEKRWSLFNVGRWRDPCDMLAPASAVLVPQCCNVVPIIAVGTGFDAVYQAIKDLRDKGSYAAPGFTKPEGVVAFHTHSRALFKMTIEKDTEHKWERSRVAS